MGYLSETYVLYDDGKLNFLKAKTEAEFLVSKELTTSMLMT
ncbi:MAG: hypothetical protein ACP5LF_04260 [Nitrososphaeria archaeon]